MSNISVSRGSTEVLDKVDGDLYVAEGATVRAKDSRKVEVSGAVQFEGDCAFACSLSTNSVKGRGGDMSVEGDLSVERTVRIRDGGLDIGGSFSAREVEVDKRASVGKDLSAEKFDVGGKARVGGNTKAREIDVGGSFEAHGDVEAEKIEAGGSITIQGTTSGSSVSVGGTFEGKGKVSVDNIRVGSIRRMLY